jgi:hypothetical protein
VSLWVAMDGDDATAERMVEALKTVRSRKVADRICRELPQGGQTYTGGGAGQPSHVTEQPSNATAKAAPAPAPAQAPARSRPSSQGREIRGVGGRRCQCGDLVEVRHGRWRNGLNWNRKYYECARNPKECRFFLWAEPPISDEYAYDI